jgi:hypothetical protein
VKSPAETRVEILSRAGFTPEYVAEIARESIGVLVDALRATRTVVTTFRGEIITEREEVDWGVRAKAAERLAMIFGYDARPQNVQPPVIVQEEKPITITLNMGGGDMVRLDTVGI